MGGFMIALLDSLNFILVLMLVALGLAVIFGLMRVINMAHGEFLMLGAYVSFLCHEAGISFWISLAAAPLVVGAFGLLIESLLIRRVYARLLDTILATWGLSLALKYAVILGFGPESHGIPQPLDASVSVLGVEYPAYRLFIMAVTLAVIAATVFFFFGTRQGLMARAVIANRDMAACVGIDTRRLDRLTFAFGTALAGFAGAVMAPQVSIDPQMGLVFLVHSFLSVLIGGLGSIWGPLAGAGVIGGTQTMITTYVTPVWAEFVVLATAIMIIRFFPTGLVSALRRIS